MIGEKIQVGTWVDINIKESSKTIVSKAKESLNQKIQHILILEFSHQENQIVIMS